VYECPYVRLVCQILCYPIIIRLVGSWIELTGADEIWTGYSHAVEYWSVLGKALVVDQLARVQIRYDTDYGY
jgi:hypothetical protein